MFPTPIIPPAVIGLPGLTPSTPIDLSAIVIGFIVIAGVALLGTWRHRSATSMVTPPWPVGGLPLRPRAAGRLA